jgi:hypothetical protein
MYIFQNKHYINKDNIYILTDIAIKITYLDNAKNILLDNNILKNIFFNNLSNQIFINNIFKIFNYNDLRKIINFVPDDFLLQFSKNIIKNKINQNIFLITDLYNNTILQRILIINGYNSTQYIWKHLLLNIKEKILKNINKHGLTINDMITPKKNGKYIYFK